VDLADIDPKTVRGVPLNAWFRFRRAVEDTPAILLLVEQESNAKTCASLVLRLGAEQVKWTSQCRPEGRRYTKHDPAEAAELSWNCLLGGYGVRAERVHARVQVAGEIAFAGAPPRRAGSGIFETRTEWGA
jgi:hypothetical protein